MAKFEITGNAHQFGSLILCIAITQGTPGQMRLKDDVLNRVFKRWPELNKDDETAPRIDEKSEEAMKVRTMELDSTEQGALAETFLSCVKLGVNGARFRTFRQVSKLIEISTWWEKQTTEKLVPFAYGDTPQNYADRKPEKDPA